MNCVMTLPGGQTCGTETYMRCKGCGRPICERCLNVSRGGPMGDVCIKCHERAYYAYMKMEEEKKRQRGW